MPPLNVARLSNLVRSLFVLRGPEGAAAEVSDEIQAVVTLEGERPEHRWLAGELLLARQMQVAAVAGQYGEWRLINPTGSGVVHVVERLTMCQIIATPGRHVLLMLPLGSADLAGPIGLWPRDSRLPLVELGAARVSTGANAAINPLVGGRIEIVTDNNGILTDFRACPIVLFPGGGIEVQNEAVNQMFMVSVMSRERPIERSEV